MDNFQSLVSDRANPRMKSIWIGTIVYLACLSLISAENTQLAIFERKILYSHLQNVDEVKQFYDKLIPAASATVNPNDFVAEIKKYIYVRY